MKLQLKLWCHKSEPMKGHIISQSLGFHGMNALWWATIYYHLPIIINKQTYFPRLWLANQKPNTNQNISQLNVWNVEIANLLSKKYTLLDVNILASTQFMDLKLWEFICIVLLYFHAKFWANRDMATNLVRRPLNSAQYRDVYK